jgi:succinate dehydrogenase / fumarate reductase cytochrome b subunit
MENRAARPVRYIGKQSRAATLASRTMLSGGLVLLAFVLYHLAHFTWGITNPEYAVLHDGKGRHDIYTMIVLGFSNIYVTVFYILAQVCLVFHLSHGFGSAAQTFGLTSCGRARLIRRGGQILACLIGLGYISIPVAVMMGWLHA